MKMFIFCLAILLHFMSYLTFLAYALPASVTKHTRNGDGIWRLPRTLGDGDLPKIVILDVLIIEQATPSPADARLVPSLPQPAPLPAPMPRPMPIGPLRFTPFTKVNGKMIKRRRGLETKREAKSQTNIKKRDVDVDGRPGPVLVVDKDILKRVLRVDRGGRRNIRRDQLDRELRPVTVIEGRANRSGTTTAQSNPKNSPNLNSPANLIIGKDGATSATPISAFLGETVPSVTGGGRGIPAGLTPPNQSIGKAKVPPGLLRP